MVKAAPHIFRSSARTARATKRDQLPWTGSPVREPPTGDGRRVYGDFYGLGVSIEWHDFQLHTDFEWSRSFHPCSVELCLNLAGSGSLSASGETVQYGPLTAGFYASGKNSLRGWRHGDQRHQFVTLELSWPFLRRELAACDGALHSLVEQVVQGNDLAGGVSEVQRLTAEQQQLIAQLLHPPVAQGARRFWYQGKILGLMAEFFFQRQGEDELFCDRQKRVARERVARVVALLRRRLSEPPSLEEIGREVGCSPFYLSRTFSAEMGCTIPQYLRQVRMERAAELLRSGRCNVTEAALEVGYSSLSHFSQAFCQTMGCCPALYPAKARFQKQPAA